MKRYESGLALLVDDGAETPFVDEDQVLHVPPALKAKALKLLKESWWWGPVWKGLRDDGLLHPRHGAWFQREEGDTHCGQYIFVSGAASFTKLMRVCRRDAGHDGPHHEPAGYGSPALEWTDEQADGPNHEYWEGVMMAIRMGSYHDD